MTDRLKEIEENTPCGYGSYGGVCTADNLCTHCKDIAYLLSLLKRRAEGDGAEIVRELRKAAYDKADLHNSTAPYGMDDMHPTDTLYSRAADYIEAMGGWKLSKLRPMTTGDDVMREVATRRVLEARGSADAPGFDACVEAELAAMSRASKVTVDDAAVERVTDEDVAAALVVLARRGVTADIQGLLVHGDERGSVAPGALKAALEAAFPASTSEWSAAIKAAAKVADEHGAKWATQWRDGFKSDSHLEGMADGADDISTAIRALSKKDNEK